MAHEYSRVTSVYGAFRAYSHELVVVKFMVYAIGSHACCYQYLRLYQESRRCHSWYIPGCDVMLQRRLSQAIVLPKCNGRKY